MTSLGHLWQTAPWVTCRGDICIQRRYTCSKCARKKQSPYLARIAARVSSQGLKSQAVPEKQDLVIGCALLRTAYQYVGSRRCSLCSPCQPRSQPSSQYRAGGKAHLNTRPQVRRVLAGIISHPPESLKEVPEPDACLQGLLQHPSGERKGKDSSRSLAAARRVPETSKGVAVNFPSHRPPGWCGHESVEKAFKTVTCDFPHRGSHGKVRDKGGKRMRRDAYPFLANCSPLQSSKYPSHTPPKQGGHDISSSAKPPEELPAPRSCPTQPTSASGCRVVPWMQSWGIRGQKMSFPGREEWCLHHDHFRAGLATRPRKSCLGRGEGTTWGARGWNRDSTWVREACG